MIRVIADIAADVLAALAVEPEHSIARRWPNCAGASRFALGYREGVPIGIRLVGGCRLGRFQPLQSFRAAAA